MKANRRVFIPLARGWCLGVTDGPLGTDIGPFASQVADRLGRRAVTATCHTGADGGYPACTLAVYGPDGEPPLLYRRTISAINDGGRWAWHESGEPFAFEETERYAERRKRDRFTPAMLQRYLDALGVPFRAPPRWPDALMLEHRW